MALGCFRVWGVLGCLGFWCIWVFGGFEVFGGLGVFGSLGCLGFLGVWVLGCFGVTVKG